MIRYELDGDAAWVTIDRPEKKNALDNPGWRDLHDALTRASEEARVAVLAGAGDAFCAGDDIATIAGIETDADVETLCQRLYEGLWGIESLPVPVVAAVDGLAYGGGFELAAAADLAVATEGSTFALPETRIGAYPPYALARITALCGKKRLMHLVLTGDAIDAATAEEWGLLNRVVTDEDELAEAVAEYVDSIAESPRPATRFAKRYAREALAAAGERADLHGGFAGVATSEACLDAARAFLDRR
jgi:enoyl-CoA hydratase